MRESFAFEIPRLRTERLLLREFLKEDFDAYANHMADADAMKHMAGAQDRRMAWRAFAAGTGMWPLTGGGWWSVVVASSGELAGHVGAFFRETSFDDGPVDLELGWSMFRAHWRRGYASEAAAAALAWGIETHAPKRVIAIINHDNLASIGVSRRLGMRYERDIDFYGITTQRYVLER
ncbi:MAG: GNAT family N-acetyltransferase [Polyangiaceae bacterium]|nr:GNAT family N-acetyltransferase [Polyangiaceae bacterium]